MYPWLKPGALRPFLVRDKDEVEELFGPDPDYLNEFGHNLPEDLIERYKATKAEFLKIQAELREYEPKRAQKGSK